MLYSWLTHLSAYLSLSVDRPSHTRLTHMVSDLSKELAVTRADLEKSLAESAKRAAEVADLEAEVKSLGEELSGEPISCRNVQTKLCIYLND